MTPEEAINWCEQFENNIIACDVATKRRTLALQTMQVAVSALEKQIPKKPIIDTNYSGGRYTVGICPNCKKLIGLLRFAKDFKCCSECGQALDWSEE